MKSFTKNFAKIRISQPTTSLTIRNKLFRPLLVREVHSGKLAIVKCLHATYKAHRREISCHSSTHDLENNASAHALNSRTAKNLKLSTKTLRTMRIVSFLFSNLVLAGGVMAFVKKNSRISLWASITFFSICNAANIFTFTKHMYPAITILLIANTSLGIYMARGFMTMRKIFPQGLVSALSFLNILICLKALTSM